MIQPKEQEAFWESDASQARKSADERNRERITDEDVKKAPSGQAWRLLFVRNGAHYWYDPSYDSSWMLEGIAPNMNFMPHVFGAFRDYDEGKRTPRVTRGRYFWPRGAMTTSCLIPRGRGAKIPSRNCLTTCSRRAATTRCLRNPLFSKKLLE